MTVEKNNEIISSFHTQAEGLALEKEKAASSMQISQYKIHLI